jgi:ankyrin repeat protein
MDASKNQLIQSAISGSVADFEKASSELPKGTAAQAIKDESGSNALHVASHHGHTELVEHLVDNYGFDANSQLDAQGRSINIY